MGQACVRSDLILFRKRDGPASGMGRDPPQSHSAEKCPDGIKESEQDRAAIKERFAEDPRRSHLLPSTYGIPIWFQAFAAGYSAGPAISRALRGYLRLLRPCPDKNLRPRRPYERHMNRTLPL